MMIGKMLLTVPLLPVEELCDCSPVLRLLQTQQFFVDKALAPPSNAEFDN